MSAPAGVWRATVTRVLGDGSAVVRVPRLSGTRDRGPCLVLEGLALVAGDRVLVGFLEGDRDRLVVLGRYQPA